MFNRNSILLTLVLAADRFTGIAGAPPVQVNRKFDFGEAITVSFDNPRNATETDFISLYQKRGSGKSPRLAMWASTCGQQWDWENATLCPGNQEGSVTFSASDPNHEYDQQWPLKKGNYKACITHMNATTGVDEDIACKNFRIKPLPKSYRCNTALMPAKESFDVNETISIDFITTKPITNSWIGVFKAEAANNTMWKLPEPDMWGYTGCDNVQGDQSENNDCAALKKSGSVNIQKANEERSVEYWPLAAGTYRPCLIYDNNNPYTQFKCAETFEIVPSYA